jgi:hypothetical protein
MLEDAKSVQKKKKVNSTLYLICLYMGIERVVAQALTAAKKKVAKGKHVERLRAAALPGTATLQLPTFKQALTLGYGLSSPDLAA